MKVTVNGRPKELKAGAKLKDAVAGEHHAKGALMSVHLSTEKLTRETDDYELVTDTGVMVLHLDDSDDARKWKQVMKSAEGMTARWKTNDIVAFGSFPTDIKVDRGSRKYKPYECFFSLGGFDNHTTYVMVSRKDHTRAYGAGTGRIGRITVGRHLLDVIQEGQAVREIRPVMSETRSENVVVTDDMGFQLEDGYSVETSALIKLDRDSPASAEQVLVLSSKGYINVTESTGSYLGCRDDMDVKIPEEKSAIRNRGSVTVRNSGLGMGHMLIYKDRRQIVPVHNDAGFVERGMALVTKAPKGSKVSVETDPPRALAVGMTQADGEKFLAGFGIKQKRAGDVSDSAIIADQTPEMTMEALSKGEAECFGVPADKVFKVSVDETDGVTAQYFRKVTGLSHKPVGSMKVQFAFPGIPMATFYGDEERGKNLYPQEPFSKCRKGDIGVTNQSRPHHGLLGIRLQDSKQYGPSGEEPYGTNIVGRFLDDVKLLGGLEEEQIIYITEGKK